MKYISFENFKNLIREVSEEKEVITSFKKDTYYDWKKCNGDEIDLRGFRTVLPLKYFFFSPQENLIEKEKKSFFIVGARACDLRGLELLKKIYLDEPEDPYYKKDNFIISVDCTEFHDNCFCVLLGDTPWPDTGFDLNISVLEDGYIVEVGSENGKEFIKKHENYFRDASSDEILKREKLREKIKNELSKKLENRKIDINKLKEKIEKNEDVFKEFGSKCVSCSACTNICPCCFCFFLSEGNKNKIRYIDSCQFPGYARVAGGANPRKDIIKRFKHRFLCKFSYRIDMQGIKGCTGCGRCIDGCQGGINFKEVIIRVNGE